MDEAAAAKLISRDRITDAAAATLFSADSVKIPDKFVRTDEVQAAGEVVGDDETFQLPVVDMAKLLDPELSALETAKLGSACREWGFFQLVNHGVDEAVMQQMKDSVAQFFSSPLETKNAVAVREGGIQGFGHHFSGASGDKLDWAEGLILFTQPLQVRNMDFWPPTNPSIFRYSVEISNLTRRLLGFMAIDLGVSQEALLGAFFLGDGAVKSQSVSMHHYPPCRHHRDKVVGITPHTVTMALTLLLHADGTPGLQVKRGGMWFPVPPLPGAVVVNVGDALDVLTNAAYVSVEHRVVPDAERDRVTVAMFHEASVQGQVAPLPELLLAGGEAPRYRSTGNLEFRKGTARAMHKGHGSWTASRYDRCICGSSPRATLDEATGCGWMVCFFSLLWWVEFGVSPIPLK